MTTRLIVTDITIYLGWVFWVAGYHNLTLHNERLNVFLESFIEDIIRT